MAVSQVEPVELAKRTPEDAIAHLSAQVVALQNENRQLRDELEQLKDEIDVSLGRKCHDLLR